MMSLKSDAEQIIKRAVDAVLPEAAVKEALKDERFLARKKLAAENNGKIILASIGKGAWRMAKAAADELPGITGAVVTKYEHSMGGIKGLEIFEAGHPVPDENTINGTRKLLAHIKDLSANDTVLFLVSGGGSALFELPATGVTLEDMADVTKQLLACGADIVEINTIRKHLSAVKGGRFAKLCAPAHVYMVVLSDVLGDRLDSIASGPAWPDASSSQDALNIVKKYNLNLRDDLIKILSQETPKELDNVDAVITGSVTALCQAAMRIASELGYEPELLTTTLSCEAREAGAFMAAIARERAKLDKKVAVIAGGETVVHLTGKGMGGRNQEFALASAIGIDGLENVVIASIGSDGTDGPTDAAGGIVDGKTKDLLSKLNIKIEDVLKNNDAYNALKAVDALVVTGPTGTNVNDFAFALINK
ncbi:MAG: glycerate kinase [Synergistaceae bacterium]|nr:glycerate kinase [Synergistaceae bacterium]